MSVRDLFCDVLKIVSKRKEEVVRTSVVGSGSYYVNVNVFVLRNMDRENGKCMRVKH